MSHLGWIQNFLLERGDKPEKGWGVGVDVEMGGGGATFVLLYSLVQSHLLCVCVGVCVWGGGGEVRFPLYLWDPQSFELAMQDSHPGL